MEIQGTLQVESPEHESQLVEPYPLFTWTHDGDDQSFDSYSIMLDNIVVAEDIPISARSWTSTVFVEPGMHTWQIVAVNEFERNASDLTEFERIELIDGIYVRSFDGDDSNLGTPDNPLRTIQAGLVLAGKIYEGEGLIHVAEGNYVVDSSQEDSLLMIEGVSILGGYPQTDWDTAARNGFTYPTIVTDRSQQQVEDTKHANRVLECDATITAVTHLDGLTLHAGGGNYSVGLFLNKAAPTIIQCAFYGGTGSEESIGILSIGSMASFQECEIDGGSGVNTTMGIYITEESNLTINSSTIQGGEGRITNGVFASHSHLTIYAQSTIEGGSAQEHSHAIRLLNSESTLQDCTIHGGQATERSYGMFANNSKSYIESCEVTGGNAKYSYGMYYETGSESIIETSTVQGGEGEMSYGIYNLESTVDIIRNPLIHGGNGMVLCQGIYSELSTVLIEANKVDGGDVDVNRGGSATAIYNRSCNPIIRNNIIYGGASSNTSGIKNYMASPIIQNNTINGGNPIGPCTVEHFIYGDFNGCASGIDSYGECHPIIQNNIIFTTTPDPAVCIKEFGLNANPTLVSHNNLFQCFPYWDLVECPPNQDICTVQQMKDMTYTSDNVFMDPQLEDIPQGLLQLTSSTPSEVSQGAANLESEFTQDYKGVIRTEPWSIGAFEQDN